MNDRKLNMRLLTPEKPLFEGEVDMVAAPGYNGEIGILPKHAPLITSLGIGELRVMTENEIKYFAVHEGFLHVLNDEVTVLATDAEPAAEINVERAKAVIGEIGKFVNLRDTKVVDRQRRAITRLKVANRIT